MDERTEVVISDNIQPRCGCPIKGRGKGKWLAYPRWMVVSPGLVQIKPIHVVECQTCGAAWEWGAICAGPSSPLSPEATATTTTMEAGPTAAEATKE